MGALADEPAQPDRHLAALRALHSVTIALHSASDLSATLDLVAQGLVRTAGFAVCAVNLRMTDDQFEVVSVAGDADGLDQLLGARESMSNWEHLLALSTRWGRTLCFLDHTHRIDTLVPVWTPDIPVPADEDGWHPEDSLFAPLMTPGGDWLGVLSVDLPEGGRRPQGWQLEILEMFAQSAAVAMMNSRLLEATTHAANHDDLTGLANRKLLAARAAELHALPHAVLVVDLDGFKTVNDSFGHQVGDEVLVAVARRMRHAVRDADLVARTGGDEFVVLLSDTDEQTIRRVFKRLITVLDEPLTGAWGTIRVTASVGAAIASAGSTLSGLLSAADADMYRNKRRSAPAPGLVASV